MAKIFGQLERAQLEILAADPTGAGLVQGRAWINSTSGLAKYYDGTAVVTLQGGLSTREAGAISNIGMSLNAGTFKICQADGSVFSATGPGIVNIPSATGGRMVQLRATSDIHSFIDDVGASQIVGEEFGITTGIAWGQDRPFFLYACNADDTDANLKFFISPNPVLKQSPATTNIGYQGVPAATPSDTNAFFLTSTNVTVSHQQKPCVLIGGIRMRMSNLDDWTVQTLSSQSGDAITNAPFQGRVFTGPTGIGGIAGSYFCITNTPTWATPANMEYFYSLDLTGTVFVTFSTTNAGNVTNGTNGTATQIGLPYKLSAASYGAAGGLIILPSGGSTQYSGAAGTMDRSVYLSNRLFYVQSNTWGATMVNNGFSNTSDDIDVHFSYRCF